MNSHLGRLLQKAEALACQCEPMAGYSCNVHQLFQEICQQIAAGAAGRAAFERTAAQSLAAVQAEEWRKASEYLTIFLVCREQYGHAKAAVVLDSQALMEQAERIEKQEA